MAMFIKTTKTLADFSETFSCHVFYSSRFCVLFFVLCAKPAAIVDTVYTSVKQQDSDTHPVAHFFTCKRRLKTFISVPLLKTALLRGTDGRCRCMPGRGAKWDGGIARAGAFMYNIFAEFFVRVGKIAR